MKLLISVLALFFMVSAQDTRSYDYENMQKETYDAELQKWRDKEAAASKRIGEVDAEIEALKPQADQLTKEEEEIWNQIYAAVDMDKAGYEAYMAQMSELRNEVSAFLSLSAEEAYKRKREINAYQKRLDAFKAQKASVLTQSENAINSIQSMIDQARDKATLPNSMYEVERGDYLWKIAKKDEVYGDPYAWVRIYNSNKGLIKDPNLIFPSQVFSIQRAVEPGKHLVRRGDSLFKIATEYGNVFTWVQLYNMNKEMVEDQNLIMPYQELSLPNN